MSQPRKFQIFEMSQSLGNEIKVVINYSFLGFAIKARLELNPDHDREKLYSKCIVKCAWIVNSVYNLIYRFAMLMICPRVRWEEGHRV